MAESGSLSQEGAVATVQVTYTSSDPIAIEYVKEEEPQVLSPHQIIEPLFKIPFPPVPTPIPQALVTTAPSVPNACWATPESVLPPLLPRLPLTQDIQRSSLFKNPSKWEEAYNVYFFHEKTNQRARQAYENRELSYPSVQRIFLATLQDVRRLTQEGKLATCYLEHMLTYGRFHNYINPNTHT